MHIRINVIIIIMQLIYSWIISRNVTFTAVRIMIELLVCWHKRICIHYSNWTSPSPLIKTAEVKQTTHFVCSG